MSAVYFARVGDYIKIGFSSDPAKRLRDLQRSTPSLIVPPDFVPSADAALELVIPFCRMRDERNLHLLFARHWSGYGEWFRWSPEFRYQMQTMRFVTEAVRKKHLRAARRELGIVGGSHAKSERWGKPTPDVLRDLAGGAA